jgi:TonB family protein
MKAPSLQKTAALSAFLHLTLFLVASLVLEQSSHMNLPSPYMVDLVSPSGRSTVAGPRNVSQKNRSAERERPTRRPAEALSKKEKMKEKLIAKRETERVEDRIARLAAIERIKRKKRMADEDVEDRIAQLAAIERIKETYKLRQVISIPAKGEGPDARQTSQPQAGSGAAGQKTIGNYMDKITGEIWKRWSWDPTMGKNLEAVISVLILKDGTIRVEKIEKSSGNTFFDRSALIALKNASPVTPPPDRADVEIGIRFFL